jgi:hypothetical protein
MRHTRTTATGVLREASVAVHQLVACRTVERDLRSLPPLRWPLGVPVDARVRHLRPSVFVPLGHSEASRTGRSEVLRGPASRPPLVAVSSSTRCHWL